MEKNVEKYKQYIIHLSKKIKRTMEQSGMTQKELVELCKKNNLAVSQTTISSILTGNKAVSIQTIFEVCDVLEIDAFNLQENFLDKEKMYCCDTIGNLLDSLLEVGKRRFCIDPNDIYFNGILGNYVCYFHSTKREESKLIQGHLSFDDRGTYCRATLILGNQKEETDYYKCYEGFLVASPVEKAAFCVLINSEIGEISYFTFWHNPILNHGVELQSKMASAATVSAGVNMRLSTVHRFFFTRRELTEGEKKIISGQLRLNDSDILIEKSRFESLLEGNELSKEFKQKLEKVGKKQDYYVVSEAQLLPDTDSEKKYFKDICVLRENSNAPTDNKVRINTDTSIYYHVINR